MRLSPALLLLASVLPATAQTATAPATTPAAGMSTYRDDALRLSYNYPKDYVDASSMVGPAFQATVGQNAATAPLVRCVSLPFSRMGSANDQMSLLLLLHADAGCLKRKFTANSVAELAEGEAKGIAASGAKKTSFGQPVNFEIASRPASRVQGSFTLPTGQAMQAMVVCVLDQPDIACWQFLSNTTAGIANMSRFPVTFDGSPAAPLVPASTPPTHPNP